MSKNSPRSRDVINPLEAFKQAMRAKWPDRTDLATRDPKNRHHSTFVDQHVESMWMGWQLANPVKPRHQAMKEAGFGPRDTRIACEECGAKCTPQLLPVHKCADLPELLKRYARQNHRMGELWERCQGKGWPDAESEEFARLRDESEPETRQQLTAAHGPYCEPGQLLDDLELLCGEAEALCEAPEPGCVRCDAAARVRAWLAGVHPWREPGPVTADHPLECLLIVEAFRQSDGEWWIEGSKFLSEDVPLAWVEDNPEVRKALTLKEKA
jgi:hypothetical protein